jgi:perosamine synthetase
MDQEKRPQRHSANTLNPAAKFPVYQPWLVGNIRAYVNECIDTGWISSRGPFVGRFEQEFAAYVGAPDAASVANGTVALHLALVALGIGAGDEVIVPSLTYVASVNTILQCGATPVFADSLSDTLQLDANSARAKVTPRTKAIMAVHLYGHPCDMDAIGELCAKHGLLLIEDAAEGFGARWRGRHVGTFGDAATFSFFGNKTVTTGEGGMVLARDALIMARLRHLKNQGVSATREYWHDTLAWNYRMTNIQAAIGLSQLELAGDILARKAALAAWYRHGLVGLPLRTHEAIGPVNHANWMCSAILQDAELRDPLRQRLAEAGIETRPFFFPAHKFPHCATRDSLPVAEGLSARGLNLPSHPGLSEKDVREISRVIRKFLS